MRQAECHDHRCIAGALEEQEYAAKLKASRPAGDPAGIAQSPAGSVVEPL